MEPQTFLISKINNKKQKYISHWKKNKYSPVFTGLPTSHPVQNGNAINLVWPPLKGFAGGSMVKNFPAEQEIWIRPLDKEDPLKREMAIQSNILAREIPWTEELADYSPKDLKESDMTKWLNESSYPCPWFLVTSLRC